MVQAMKRALGRYNFPQLSQQHAYPIEQRQLAIAAIFVTFICECIDKSDLVASSSLSSCHALVSVTLFGLLLLGFELPSYHDHSDCKL